MNKYQEAFGRIVDNSDLKIHVENGIPMNQDTKDVLLIQELVDKAIPKKLDRYIFMKIDSDGLPTHGFCKECGTSILIKSNFCPNCGQAIDWSTDD